MATQERIAGVYAIRNVANGMCYFGSSIDCDRTEKTHRRDLQRNTHRCHSLQSAWNEYGEASFEFVLLEATSTDLCNREQAYRDTHPNQYNCGSFASSPMRGRKHTEEARAKIGEASRRRIHSSETVAKRNAANRGKKRSEETKQRISLANKGRIVSPEVAKRYRKKGYWWNEHYQAWEIRMCRSRQPICHAFCGTEYDAQEAVRILREQLDGGLPIAVPRKHVRWVVGERRSQRHSCRNQFRKVV